MEKIENRPNWIDLKRRLAGNSPFIDQLEKPIESQARAIIDGLGSYTLPLMPTLYDKYLSDVSSSLDKCLAYRREARELEIAAVKAALDYDHFLKTSVIEEELERKKLLITAKMVRRDVLSEILKTTQKPTSELGTLAYASIAAEKASLDQEVTELDLAATDVGNKWAEAARINEDYHSRCVAPGNAHNYVERYLRVMKIYADELYEVLAKSNSIYLGINNLYGSFPSVPSYDQNDLILDSLVMWVRDAIRFVNNMSDQETVFIMTFPLVQPWRAEPSESFISKSVFHETFKSRNNVKTLAFNFSDAMFGLKHVRIVGLGLSFGSDLLNGADGISWRDKVSGLRLRADHPSVSMSSRAGAVGGGLA